jgi:hypothetical protein
MHVLQSVAVLGMSMGMRQGGVVCFHKMLKTFAILGFPGKCIQTLCCILHACLELLICREWHEDELRGLCYTWNERSQGITIIAMNAPCLH